MLQQESETILSPSTSSSSGFASGDAPLKTDDDPNYRPSSEELAEDLGLPMSVVQPALVAYRSFGIGIFGAAMRWGGMVCIACLDGWVLLHSVYDIL